ncbi:hypothetical protein ABEB36_015448 [Hypothenemus hampei]|uniref:CCHC-type domain-containing protein n=1 Tax=Hypothenemus hampei TaxID=57062 RepID=A0ABD1E171_HYPHA
MGDTINLNTIIAEANSLETIERQLLELNGKPLTTPNDVNTISTRNNNNTSVQKCYRCGFEGNQMHHQCQAKTVICHKCNRIGHYARCCLRKQDNDSTNRKRSQRLAPYKKFKPFKRSTKTPARGICSIETEEEQISHLDNDEDKVECEAQKSNWQQDLLDYQMMYNSTPHSVTGKTPC